MSDLTMRMDFIRRHTRLTAVGSVPGLVLWQADEVTTLWQMTEDDMARAHLPPPFWAFAWAGGQALARYVLEHPETVRGRRVLDLACGSGLVGIAAARAGAANVICNDIDPFAAAAVTLNAQANQVFVDLADGDLLNAPLPEVDLILAGDICYERAMSDAMLSYFRRAQRDKIEVMIGDPHRSYFPHAAGLQKLADYTISTQGDIEDVRDKPASVWKLETRHGTDP